MKRERMAEKVPGWLERILLPQISEVKGEIKAIHSEIRRVDEKIEAVDEKLSMKIDDLNTRLDVSQRLATIEEKVRGLESKDWGPNDHDLLRRVAFAFYTKVLQATDKYAPNSHG